MGDSSRYGGSYDVHVEAPDNSAFASSAGGSDANVGAKGKRANIPENPGARLTITPSPKMAYEQGDGRTMANGRIIRSYPGRTENFIESATDYGVLGPMEGGARLQ